MQTAHVFRATNLPKSFGCLLKLREEALQYNREAFVRLSNRMSSLSTEQQRTVVNAQQLSNQHVPFTTNNLREFEAHLQKMFFVFNLNDEMLKENEYIYRHRDLTSSQFDFTSPFSLGDEPQLPFMISHQGFMGNQVPSQPI